MSWFQPHQEPERRAPARPVETRRVRAERDLGAPTLPEGDLKIARQFTAGFGFAIPQVPKGRPNPANVMRLYVFPFLWHRFSRPFGTRLCLPLNPALKRWAILKSPSGRWERTVRA